MVLNPYQYDDSEIDLGPEPDFSLPPEPPPPPLPFWLLTVPVSEYDASQPRDHTGKWTSGGSATTQVGVRGLERYGGTSVRAYGTKAPQPQPPGIMVSYSAKHGHNQRIQHAETLTHQQRVELFREHFKRNRDFVMASPDRYAGGWLQTHSDGTATLHLDVSRRITGPGMLERATTMGHRENQISGYDLTTGETIDFGGTGD